MGLQAQIDTGVVVGVIVADPADVVGLPGTWVDVTGQAVSVGSTYAGGVFTPPTPATRYILSGREWVERFTADEWAWLKSQRVQATTAGKQLDRMLDAILFTNSIDVSSSNLDPFYAWLVAQGLPGGQTRVDELRAGV